MDQNNTMKMLSTEEKQSNLRLRKLQTTLDRSLSLVGEEFSYEKLQNIFPELSKDLGDKFKDFYDHLYGLLIHSTQDDFSSIQIEYDVENKFLELDKLIFEAKTRAYNDDKPNAELSPEAELSSRVYPLLDQTNERVKAKLAEQDETNAELLTKYQHKKAELDTKVKYLLSVYHSIPNHQ